MAAGRTDLWSQELGWPGQLFVGRYRQSSAKPLLPPHRHAGMLEICHLAKGVQVYAVGGRRFLLRGGDCFVTRPDEEHSTDGTPQEKGELCWLQVRPPQSGEAFLGVEQAQVAGLFARLLAIRRRVFPASERIPGLFAELIAAWRSGPEDLRRLVVAQRVLAVLLLVAEDAARTAPRERPGGDLERVFALIAGELHRPLPLAELAHCAGLSLPRFKVVFRRAVGLPPAEYVLRRRLDAALAALHAGASVTRAALDWGFHSSQYFATVCRRYTGASPSALVRPGPGP